VKFASAWIGSSVFFLIAPTVVAGLIPWVLTHWEMRGVATPIRALGVMLIAAGLVVLSTSFLRFVVEGLGTPAPVAPTQHLVVGGMYRYVRNPMYLAVVALVVGQAILLGHPRVLIYGVVVGLAMVAFARWYEEPALGRQFGERYEEYRRNVPGWWPRLSPWKPGDQ